MGKAEEIKKLARAWDNGTPHPDTIERATILVELGWGTKDRFEIIDCNSLLHKKIRRYITSIKYKE